MSVARDIVFAALERTRHGSVTIAEGDTIRTFGSGEPSGLIDVHSPAVWPKLLRGSRGLAESYADGLWDTPDLAALIGVAARNTGPMDAFRRRLRPLLAPFQIVAGTWRANDPRSSRKQIASHYDIGNDLYELMLDETMTYSCTWFARDDMTLHEAAVAKLDLVCDQLDLQPHDHLLEIGTGWGGLAVHVARTRGCRVTTTTISREQYDLARQRVHEAGVGDRVEVLLKDYRDLRGRYDKLVSIEMIEAVGWRNFPVFFRHCSELLKDDGLMLLQAITIDDRAYEVEKTANTFIRKYIFPNGALPSPGVIARCVASQTDMRAIGVQDLTQSYVRTLQEWRANFDRHEDAIAALGYGQRFRRMWRFYLAYVEAGFEAGRIGDIQLLLAKPSAPLSAAEPPATASVASGEPSGRSPLAAVVEAMSAKSPAMLAASQGRSGAPRTAADRASAWRTTSRAPSPRTPT